MLDFFDDLWYNLATFMKGRIMKDYTLSKDEERDYIKDFIEEANGTYTVVFASGKKFTNISPTDNNLATLIRQQEAQARDAVANYDRFVIKRNIDGVLTTLSGVAAGIGGHAISMLPLVQSTIGNNPFVVAAGIGTIAVLGAIPMGAKLVRDCGRVRELKKIKMRDENAERLNQILTSLEHRNRLQGLKQESKDRLREVMHEGWNPWSIMFVDEPYFDLKEMQTLLDNGEIQDKYGFEYTKRPSK